MENQDNRWQQRLANFGRALAQLERAVVLSNERTLSELETQGLIQTFEFTYELAWKTMKDYFEYQGNTTITGSRDATREAFKYGLIADGEGWLAMIASRNKTSHTYDEATAQEIALLIVESYFVLFTDFLLKMKNMPTSLF